jgi:hypothetical protein
VGEYQHAPSTEAYAESVREIISKADNIPSRMLRLCERNQAPDSASASG